MICRAAVLLLLLAAPHAVAAQQADRDTLCAASRTQAETEVCLSDMLREADRQLNMVYRAVLSDLSPTSARRLRAAQRAWIRYRDLDCEAARSLVGEGSAAPLVTLGCLLARTEERTRALAQSFDSPMTSGVP